jgi:hypothetical protein
LRRITLRIPNIKTQIGLTRWKNDFKQFFNDYDNFLKTKSYKDEEEWFTHVKTRSFAINLLKIFNKGELFRFIDEKRFAVSNTNNFIEGGINAPLRRLLWKHSGAKINSQMKMVEIYLLKRSVWYHSKIWKETKFWT